MKRLIVMVTAFAFVFGVGAASWAAEKMLATQKTKNDFVLEFASAKDKQPVDVGKVTLNTSMTMSGMAPMIAGATVKPDKTPGRYLGTIEFPDTGARQVTVAWDGPAGKSSTKFSVPVR